MGLCHPFPRLTARPSVSFTANSLYKDTRWQPSDQKPGLRPVGAGQEHVSRAERSEVGHLRKQPGARLAAAHPDSRRPRAILDWNPRGEGGMNGQRSRKFNGESEMKYPQSAKLRTLLAACGVALLAATASAPVQAAGKVILALDPPTADTNLFWNGTGERLPCFQGLVGHDPITGKYNNSEIGRVMVRERRVHRMDLSPEEERGISFRLGTGHRSRRRAQLRAHHRPGQHDQLD